MNMRIRFAAAVLLFAGMGLASVASAQTAAGGLPDTGRVQVGWQDPNTFTEVATAGNKRRALEGDWVRQLALYIERQAERPLPVGQHMRVTILDVDRAGDRRGVGEGVPVVRAVSPPSIRLHVVRTDTYGRVVDQGDRTLEDPSVLGAPTRTTGSDPLVFEKRLVDGWLASEFPPK